MAKESSTVRQRVVATVIGGAILGILAWFGPSWYEWSKDAVPATLRVLLNLLSYLDEPGWFVILLILFAAHGINKLIPHSITWRNYLTDEFYEIVWTWKIGDKKGSADDPFIYEITPHCKFHSIELVYPDDVLGHETRFVCQLCDEVVATRPGNWKNVRDAIERMVRQKIRTGEWNQQTKSRRLVKWKWSATPDYLPGRNEAKTPFVASSSLCRQTNNRQYASEINI